MEIIFAHTTLHIFTIGQLKTETSKCGVAAAAAAASSSATQKIVTGRRVYEALERGQAKVYSRIYSLCGFSLPRALAPSFAIYIHARAKTIARVRLLFQGNDIFFTSASPSDSLLLSAPFIFPFLSFSLQLRTCTQAPHSSIFLIFPPALFTRPEFKGRRSPGARGARARNWI